MRLRAACECSEQAFSNATALKCVFNDHSNFGATRRLFDVFREFVVIELDADAGQIVFVCRLVKRVTHCSASTPLRLGRTKQVRAFDAEALLVDQAEAVSSRA